LVQCPAGGKYARRIFGRVARTSIFFGIRVTGRTWANNKPVETGCRLVSAEPRDGKLNRGRPGWDLPNKFSLLPPYFSSSISSRSRRPAWKENILSCSGLGKYFRRNTRNTASVVGFATFGVTAVVDEIIDFERFFFPVAVPSWATRDSTRPTLDVFLRCVYSDQSGA